jgi:hypothetical protein
MAINKLHKTRKFLVDKFINNFAINHPDVPIRHENVRFEHNTINKPFIDLREEPVVEHHAALGGRFMRRNGMFIIEALAPEDTGTIDIRDYLAEASSIYRNMNEYIGDVGYLTVTHITYNQLALYKGLYSLSIVVHYQLDLCNV